MNTETTDPEELQAGDKTIIAITMPEGYEGASPRRPASNRQYMQIADPARQAINITKGFIKP